MGDSAFQVFSKLDVEYSSETVAGQKPHHSEGHRVPVQFFYCCELLAHCPLLLVVQTQGQEVDGHHEYLQTWGQGQLEEPFRVGVRHFVMLVEVLCCQ